jgi:hypothetical protein
VTTLSSSEQDKWKRMASARVVEGIEDGVVVGFGNAYRERFARHRVSDLGGDGGLGAAARPAAHELCRPAGGK